MADKRKEQFQLTHETIDGLVHRGYLRSGDRYNQRAVEAALQRFFRATFGGADQEKPQPWSPRPMQRRPVSTHVISPEAQQSYNDLVLERLLIVLAKRELMSPEIAIQVLEEVATEAGRRSLPPGVADSARFAKEVLAFELKAEGLL
jgi:hypothetical protein